jgi:hypothetical protein
VPLSLAGNYRMLVRYNTLANRRTAISLGYPDEGTQRRRTGPARKPLSEIVHEERYG